jgi:hypothetical protein
MKMARKSSNRAHKSGFHVVSTLSKISKSCVLTYSFSVPQFRALQFQIQAELAQVSIGKVEALT